MLNKISVDTTKYLKWFFVFSLFSSAIAIILMCTAFKSAVMSNIFSDFGETLAYCLEDNPYDKEGVIQSMYPPFAFLIFYPLALICKEPIKMASAGKISIFQLSKTPQIVAVSCIYSIISIALIIWCCVKISGFKGKNRLLLIGILMLWGPFFYCFQRANTILTTTLFISLFFVLYNSKVKWKKELSLLCLAFAIAIKIYPVMLALLFLKNRDWKSLFKTAIYSIILVFVPFVFIKGNFIENVKYVLANSTSASSQLEHVGGNISVLSLVSSLQFLSHQAILIITWVLKICLLICSTVVILISKNSKNQLNIFWVLICTYLLFPDVSMGYAAACSILAFIYFLVNFNSFNEKEKWFYMLFFVLLYTQIFYGIKQCQCVMVLVMAIYLKSTIELFKEFKQARTSSVDTNKS